MRAGYTLLALIFQSDTVHLGSPCVVYVLAAQEPKDEWDCVPGGYWARARAFYSNISKYMGLLYRETDSDSAPMKQCIKLFMCGIDGSSLLWLCVSGAN